MFTVMFALGRLPGWIAQWKRLIEDKSRKIARPRQIYTGRTLRHLENGGKLMNKYLSQPQQFQI
jgi:citrate synthase